MVRIRTHVYLPVSKCSVYVTMFSVSDLTQTEHARRHFKYEFSEQFCHTRCDKKCS